MLKWVYKQMGKLFFLVPWETVPRQSSINYCLIAFTFWDIWQYLYSDYVPVRDVEYTLAFLSSRIPM